MKEPRRRTARAHSRLLEFPEDDPLGGLANLFDTGVVFGVALLVSWMSRSAAAAAPSAPIPPEPALPLERYRAGDEILGGEGERLGTAYRLKSGEVVYIPDEPARPR